MSNFTNNSKVARPPMTKAEHLQRAAAATTTWSFKAAAANCAACGQALPLIGGIGATLRCSCGHDTHRALPSSPALRWWAMLPGTSNRMLDSLGPFRSKGEAEAVSTLDAGPLPA